MTIIAKRTQRQFMPRGFLANISLGWKMGLMVFVLFLGILGVSVSAYVGLQSLDYQLSNIYDFMLVPIVAINHADTALAEAVYQIENVDEGTEIGLAEGIKDIQANNKLANEVITRYDTEWVTTSSLEFTQALREGGKLALQEQEISALADYHAAFNDYLASVDLYLATVQSETPDAALADETLDNLQVARAHLQELIDINNEYADFSNALAHEAYRLALVTSGIALAIAIAIGLFMSYLIALSITSRLGELTLSAEAMQGGNLDQTVAVQGRDEVSLLGTAFNNMASQLKELFATLEQRVADRTKAIATSSAVSRRLSTILNRKELAIEVVEQVKKAFGYYHAHIYLYNDAKDELLMAGGTGDAGAAMLASGHKVPRGRGLVGRAAESNESVLVPDTSRDPDWLPNPLLPETRSEVAIPISAGDQVLGVLDVQHHITEGLSQDDVDSLTAIANQVAVAMQNIESAETVAKRAKELETVASISTATATIQDPFEMLATMVRLTQRGFGLYHAHVFTYHEESEQLQIMACGYREGDEHEGTHGTASIPFTQEQSLVARAARTRQPVIVNDVRSDPGWLPNPLLPDTRAELAVPMVVGDRLLGVLDVQSDRIDAFTDEDANIQMTLASQVATALQNTRSYAASQLQSEHETKLNLIAQKIQNTTTIEEAMQIAARELGHALGRRQTLVTLEPAGLAGGSKVIVNE